MTPQEQQLLQELTAKVNQTVLSGKDPEAEQFLGQSLGNNPDALYILAQTVLVQNYALTQAKQQLEASRQQAEQAAQPAQHTSFLGSLFGTGNPPPPPPSPPPSQVRYAPPQYAQPAQTQPSQTQYAPVPNYPPPPPYGQPPFQAQPGYASPMGMGMGMGGGSSFLGSALRTAGGVAAGALAFEGIESLMHGFGEHAGYGSPGFGNMGGGRPEEIVNNYYGDSDEHEHGRQGLSNDLEDRRDDSQGNFADTGNSGDYTVDDPASTDSTDYGSDDSGSSGDFGSGDYGSDDSSSGDFGSDDSGQ